MDNGYKLALLGFGNVGQAFARLLLEKRKTLSEVGVAFQAVGIATGSHGIAVDPEGIDLERALSLRGAGRSLEDLSVSEIEDSETFIRVCGGDILFETTPVNYQTGQPALDYLCSALGERMHVVTANKGAVVHGYQQLTELAQQHQRGFFFESTVMDGAPVFAIARCGMPAAQVTGFRGILNSTTNFILGRMEGGESLEDAIARAQEMGIAESDPRGDVDGWDAAVKVAALATVMMGVPLKPGDVERKGIGDINPEDMEHAAQEGKRWKLVCQARRKGDQGKKLTSSVAPRMVTPSSPLYHVSGTSAVLQIESDVLGTLTLGEEDPTPKTTAYGLLADFLNAVKN